MSKYKPTFSDPYSLDPDSLFTRDDLNELWGEIQDYLDANGYGEIIKITGVYFDVPRTLEVDYDSDVLANTISVEVNYRRIRKPSDLLKYTEYIATKIIDEYDAFWEEAYNSDEA